MGNCIVLLNVGIMTDVAGKLVLVILTKSGITRAMITVNLKFGAAVIIN
ncbi:hypothetical protein [Bacillus mycoides]|nr:hypothetical protein [Bacillus mycoides]QWJ09312.1 hypothetical protein J5V76_28745 [Bacillus mycoides]